VRRLAPTRHRASPGRPRPPGLAPTRRLASPRRPRRPSLAPVLLLTLTLAGCAASSAEPRQAGGTLRIVAAENFWGSIARQLAGHRASVQSIIVNPAQDPHSYEPTAQDARTLATAELVIVNGLGYDPWAPRLIASGPLPGRVVLTVGTLLGLKTGGNPHRWYDPADVERVIGAISHALIKLEPTERRYFERQKATFERAGLGEYHRLIADIRSRYAGTPIGASESIFALMAPSLGLKLLTPSSFMDAIGEGTEISAHDASTTERQITGHDIKVWVYNAQNVTPEIQHLNALARASQIPVATVTETLSPAGASFERWQVAQLRRLEAALRTATGR
jgi:zinc/manganese transport system substrate-binding protein